jgi:3'-5' exoribonuclease
MKGEDSEAARSPIKDLKPGAKILQFFELRAKELRRTRAGEEYLDLTVGDSTGRIQAKMWPEALRKWGKDFEPGEFVKIEGRVETYRDSNQLVVEKIRRVQESEVTEPEDLVHPGAPNVDGLLAELFAAAKNLRPSGLSQLIVGILSEHADSLKTFPAAKMVHHAYKGGLIEHTVAVTRKVEAIALVDQSINKDMAIGGAILHDIGKLLELNPGQGGRSAEGRLLGHLILGVEMIREQAAKQGISDRKWLRDLQHIVISHHGEPQFGSSVRPMTREAMVVHFIDNMDSKLKILETALESQEPDGFSPYNRWLEGRAYIGSYPTAEEETDA